MMNLDNQNNSSAIIHKFTGRIPELDGLRGLAVVFILIYHFVEWAKYDGDNSLIHFLFSASRLGATGVDMFFVLSGFLICGILLDHRDSKNYFKVFYIRRTLRLFPLYYALLILFCLLVFARTFGIMDLPDWIFTFKYPIWSYFTYTQNLFFSYYNSFGAPPLAPTWSLAVEEQFYLILPLIVRFFPRRYLVPLFFAIIISCLFFRIVISNFDPTNVLALHMLTITRTDSLLMGALTAIAVRSSSASDFIVRHRRKLKFLFPLLVGLLFVLMFYYFASLKIVFYLIVALFYTALMIFILVAREEGVVRHFFRNRVLIELGAISYFIYLTHMFVLNSIHWFLGINGKIEFGLMWFFLISIVSLICFSFAKLSQYFFEAPMIKFGHAFRYQ
ncbi:MAG: acyltransferase [Pyrinomonadaceae bacterium]